MEKGKDSRRAFLKKAALAGAGATMGGDLIRRISDLWAAKAQEGSAALSLHEMLTLAAVGAQIIPTDDVPGAREAGVVDYLDSKIKPVEAARNAYHAGLQEIDNASQKKFGALFIKLPVEQQKDVLKSLEKSDFFARVRRDVIEAFCRSPVGQKVTGYPGASQPHGYPNIASAPGDTH